MGRNDTLLVSEGMENSAVLSQRRYVSGPGRGVCLKKIGAAVNGKPGPNSHIRGTRESMREVSGLPAIAGLRTEKTAS